MTKARARAKARAKAIAKARAKAKARVRAKARARAKAMDIGLGLSGQQQNHGIVHGTDPSQSAPAKRRLHADIALPGAACTKSDKHYIYL